jgi:NADPH2:quinone reductase
VRAVTITNGHLAVVDREVPRPVADQVLVEVAGAGVNRADLLQRAGRYPAPEGWPADIPGLEFAGTVTAAGPDVGTLEIGSRVCGILGGGGHATHVLTRAWLCAPVPGSVDLREAGGLPEVFMTAHDALFTKAGLRPGERVLIHGVGSGVGTAATQLASAAGARTVGTSRTASKLERARSLGLDVGVVAGEDMAERIGEVDVVIDLVGGGYLATDVAVCRALGRIVIVGLLAGRSAALDLAALMQRRLSIIGTVMRGRPDHEKATATERFAHEVVPLFEAGLIRPVTERTLSLEDAEEAYDVVESNGTFGKVVLTPGG